MKAIERVWMMCIGLWLMKVIENENHVSGARRSNRCNNCLDTSARPAKRAYLLWPFSMIAMLLQPQQSEAVKIKVLPS
jgi:hypothetical protein